MPPLDSPKQTRLSTDSKVFVGCALVLMAVLAFAFIRNWATDTSIASTRNAPYSTHAKCDPLQSVLQLIENGDMDGAIDKFISNGTTNWIETTSLKEFRISESEFASLGTYFSRSKQTALQQKFIQRVTEIKNMARILRDRAISAESRGDIQEADAYIHAINRLGEQLTCSNTVLVFQQTGMALQRISLP